MKKIFNLIPIISILMIVFNSCNSSGKKTEENTLVNINVTSADYQKRTLFSQFFDSIKPIRLETKDESLIGNIDRIIFHENQLYILDSKQSIIFVFDDQGKFLWKISKKGSGPGEYGSIADFDLNNDKLFLFDSYRNILEYDMEGKFIKTYPAKKIFGTSMAVNNNFAYLYLCNYPSSQGAYHLLIMDLEKDDLKGELPMTQKQLIGHCMIFDSKTAFYRYNDKIRFFMPLSTTIYSVSDSVVPVYNFDFGEFNIPENYFTDHTKSDLGESRYAYGLNSFWENDLYLSFEIRFNQNIWNVLYSKKENKVRYGSFYDDMAFCFPRFQISTNDYLLGFRNMNELFDEYNHSKENRQNTLLEKIVSEADVEDNPVVLFYYFKK